MRPAFIGREKERAFLSERLQRAGDGQGGAVLVLGDAGLGKSALLDQLETAASQFQVVWGRAWEAGGAPPFWPWTQALRALERTGWTAPEGLSPILAQDPTERSSLAPGEARFALLEALSRGLCDRATDRPTLIVLDDLHAADPSTIAALEVVADSARHVPLLIVAAARERELRSFHPAACDRLQRRAGVVHLKPLDDDEVRRYVAAVGAHDAERLVRRSEGHPLYLQELVRLQSDVPGASELPASIEATLGTRLDALPESVRQTIAIAAVWGREVRDDDLAAVRPEVDVTSHLAAAKAAGLLRSVDVDGCPGHRFGHILQREAAYARLDDPSTHHAAIARRLEARPEPPWIEIAHHLRAARRTDRYPAVRAAARLAHARLAFDVARDLAEEAVGIAPADEAIDASIALAEAQLLLGEIEAGRRTCLEAAERAEAAGDSRALGRAALAYGSVIVAAQVDDQLAELLRRSLFALHREGADDPATLGMRAEILARLTAAEHPAPEPDLDTAFARAREAVSLARSVGDPGVLLRTMRPAIAVLMDLGDPVERLEMNVEYVTIAERLGERVEVWRGHTRSVFDRWELGDFEGAARAIDAAEAAAEAVGLPSYRWSPPALRAGIAVHHGDFAGAAARRRQAATFAQASKDAQPGRILGTQRLFEALLRGEPRRLETAMAELRGLPGVEGGWLTELVLPVVSLALRIHRGETVTVARRRVDYALAFEDRGMYDWLAHPLARTDERDAQGALADALGRHRGRWWCGGFTGHLPGGPVDRAYGVLRAARGELDEAREALDAAAAACRSAGARPQLAWCLWELAAVRAARGEDGASATADEARVLANEVGVVLGAPIRTGTPNRIAPTPVGLPFSLERDGETWCVTHGEQSFRLKDTRGLRLLDRLVTEAGRELHVLDLAGAASMLPAASADIPALDEEAKAAYRARVRTLRAELASAENANDLGRIERSRAELEALEDELTRALGLGGRDRKRGSVAERARVNVQRRLKDALRRIAEHDPALAKHLDRSLTTGTYCVYEP